MVFQLKRKPEVSAVPPGNTLSEDGVSFEESSEAVAFIAGHYLADKWHQEMNEKIEAA